MIHTIHRPNLRLGFADTYDNAKKFFVDVLSRRYNITRDDENPDYLIFGDKNFGETHYRYTKAKKIFFTGENVRPNYLTYDHAITFDHENSRKHYRLPLYVLELWAIKNDNGVTEELHNRVFDAELEYDTKKRFTAYVQSNPNCEPRTKFVQFLLSKNSVDCAGPHLNNTKFILPRDRMLKINFFREAKFGISFENGSYPGYVTEKLIDAYYARTIPIYWGSAMIHRDFNPKSFIDASKYNFTDLFDHMREVASDKNKYLDILTQPAFHDNIPNEYMDLDAFLNWFNTFIYEE